MFNKLKQLFFNIQSQKNSKPIPNKCRFIIHTQPKKFEKITMIQPKFIKYKLD